MTSLLLLLDSKRDHQMFLKVCEGFLLKKGPKVRPSGVAVVTLGD
jgi:hypothetical protein